MSETLGGITCRHCGWFNTYKAMRENAGGMYCCRSAEVSP